MNELILKFPCITLGKLVTNIQDLIKSNKKYITNQNKNIQWIIILNDVLIYSIFTPLILDITSNYEQYKETITNVYIHSKKWVEKYHIKSILS